MADEIVVTGMPECVPVTDVGVRYDIAPLVLTLPGWMDRRDIERHLKRMAVDDIACVYPYEYRCHTWRNAVGEPRQRDI